MFKPPSPSPGGQPPRASRRSHPWPAPVAFVVAAVIVADALFVSGSIWHILQSSHGTQVTAVGATRGISAAVSLPPNKSARIIAENAHVGTSDWMIARDERATTQIQAYADSLSVSEGQQITFNVSVQQEGTPYTLSIYRLGWYGGKGGRLLLTAHVTGHAQGYFDEATWSLVSCVSCLVDRQTGLVEAHWQPSARVTIPSSWMTGVYLAKFTDSAGKATALTFDVRDSSTSTYIAVTPDTTVAAYNTWGGYSLYQGLGGTQQTHAVRVSFDRPTINFGPFPWEQEKGMPFDQGLPLEIDAIRWLEREGYNVSYISSVDLNENPDQLLHHRAYLSLGHDEYWSQTMRDGVEHARDAGIGLAFLGANAAYWQIRLEPDGLGMPDRTIVCYKDGAADPLHQRDVQVTTVEWRDPLLSRPENALIGIMYSGHTHQPIGFPWTVSGDSAAWPLVGTGLQTGQQYGCDLVGYEWDRTFSNGVQPRALHVLGSSAVVDVDNRQDTSNTTYYIAPTGALVFATGSIYWTYALDNLRLLPEGTCSGHSAAIPQMQALMANIMDGLYTLHRQSGQH